MTEAKKEEKEREKLGNLKIDKEVFDEFKNYCNENDIKLNKHATKILKEYMQFVNAEKEKAGN